MEFDNKKMVQGDLRYNLSRLDRFLEYGRPEGPLDGATYRSRADKIAYLKKKVGCPAFDDMVDMVEAYREARLEEIKDLRENAKPEDVNRIKKELRQMDPDDIRKKVPDHAKRVVTHFKNGKIGMFTSTALKPPKGIRRFFSNIKNQWNALAGAADGGAIPDEVFEKMTRPLFRIKVNWARWWPGRRK